MSVKKIKKTLNVYYLTFCNQFIIVLLKKKLFFFGLAHGIKICSHISFLAMNEI